MQELWAHEPRVGQKLLREMCCEIEAGLTQRPFLDGERLREPYRSCCLPAAIATGKARAEFSCGSSLRFH